MTLYVADRIRLAIVHGSHGFYALDLRGVQKCPDNSLAAEGQQIYHGHIFIVCADGSVYAEFDAYGRAVRGTLSADRPAYRVVAHTDGSLIVFQKSPPHRLTYYWPS